MEFLKWFIILQLIMPGYCVSGTVGAKVLSGQKKVEMENRQVVDVKLSVQVSYENTSLLIC